MQGDDAGVRIRDLREQLRYHNYRYYILASPVITDGEYDTLFRELQDLEEQWPKLVTADSPTQCVGYPIGRGDPRASSS